MTQVHITVKELIPIVIAAMLWGHKWAGKTVKALCDNMAIVHVLHSRQSKDHEIMHLLRCLSLVECHFDFILVSKHLPGKLNILADALFLDKLPLFHSNYPQAHPNPTPIPPILPQLLVGQMSDWTCTNWANLFRAIYYLQGLAKSTQKTYTSANHVFSHSVPKTSTTHRQCNKTLTTQLQKCTDQKTLIAQTTFCFLTQPIDSIKPLKPLKPLKPVVD